jgi:hypothetical protein
MDSLAASLGKLRVNFLLFRLLMTRCDSFGLLHRIPPQPDNRTPGTMPVELQDKYDEKRESSISDHRLDGIGHSPRAVGDGSSYLEQNHRS